MKVVILAGGLGTRFSEETTVRPKPMVEIGGNPVLWHIMKIYSAHGLNDFVICLGYKGYMIKEYFANYFLHRSDVTIDLRQNKIDVHMAKTEPWRVTLVDTGDETQTGGRLKRVLPYVKDDADFCLTYGDGLADVDITAVIAQHRREGRLATVTAAQPPGPLRRLDHDGDQITASRRSRRRRLGQRRLLRAVAEGCETSSTATTRSGSTTRWSASPRAAQLGVHLHRGFWQPMDTLRDKTSWKGSGRRGSPPWKVWT